jgi:hypothetical protein
MVTGYKIDRHALWNNYPDAAEIISNDEPNGVCIVESEGCDDAIVGIISHKCGPYDNGGPESFVPPLVSQVRDKLNSLGLQVGTGDIRHYFYGAWG